jgi:limonene-1,2-epoxide hydrolase
VGKAQEDVVLEFMAAWGDGTQEKPDIDKIVSMFAEDAVWQLWIPGGPTLRGRAAIEKDIHRQLVFATYMRCGLINMTSDDRTVSTERLDHFISNGTKIDHYLVAVFEVDEDGKIAAWREYFDSADINRQLTAVAATVPRADV